MLIDKAKKAEQEGYKNTKLLWSEAKDEAFKILAAATEKKQGHVQSSIDFNKSLINDSTQYSEFERMNYTR